jgi:hypothetical protein
MPEIVLEAQKWNELRELQRITRTKPNLVNNIGLPEIFALFGVIRSIRILYVIFFITI